MIEHIVETLFQISLTAVVMIGVVLLIRAVVGMRVKAKLLSVLWLMVLVRLVLPITLEAPFRVNTWLVQINWEMAVQAPEETASVPEAEIAPLVLETDATVLSHLEVSAATASNTTVKRSNVFEFLKAHIYHGLIAIWLVGAALFFAVTEKRMRKFRAHVKSSSLALDDGWLEATVLSYKLWLNIRRDIQVVASSRVDVPVVMGVFRPVIILPKGLAEALDREKLKVILLHEICHIKRYDLFINALWLVAKGLHWFNPLVWAAYKAYLADTEQACDVMVLGALNEESAIVYSEALVAVMRQAKGCATIPAYVSFCRKSSHLRKRVTNMLKPKKKPVAVSALVIILMIVLGVGCFTTACMKETEQENTASTGREAVQVTADTDAGEEVPQKSIFVDSVQTEERAIEIAKKFNHSGADSFTYMGMNKGLLDVHEVQADDDTNTNYSIYNINGEILRMNSAMYISAEPTSISEDEAKAYAEEYAKMYYGDVVLTIETCETLVNSGFMITGAIYKDSEGSTRNFFIEMNGAGKLISIVAIYDEIYALNISDEMIAKVKSYAIDISEPVRMMGKFKEFGVEICEFYFEEGSMVVDLNAEDGSLIRISLGELDIGDKFTMKEEEAKGVALNYIDKYFPEATDVVISGEESKSGATMYMGTLNKGSLTYTWDVAFNNEAELWEIGIKRDYDYSIMEKLDIDETEKIAREIVKEDCPYVDTDSLVLIKAYESESENTPDLYMYEFSYTSAKPSVTDFSFEAEVGVNKYSGAFGTSWIKPSTEGIDVLSEKELIEKAKGYIVEAYDVDPDGLKLREISLVGFRLLEYNLSFDYNEYVSYNCNMIADTGELDGVGESSTKPMMTDEGMTEDQLGYDKVAGIVGDYYDDEITYYNKTADEEVTYVVDNPFCWVMDSVPWNEAGEEDISNSSIGYNEYIDILGCHVVKTDTGLTLYYEDVAYLIDTDPKVFDDMVDMIKSK